VVDTLNHEREGLVFLLWGSYAQAKGKVIDDRRHRVLKRAASLAAVGASRVPGLRAFLGRQRVPHPQRTGAGGLGTAIARRAGVVRVPLNARLPTALHRARCRPG
jgi:hypothetical protein